MAEVTAEATKATLKPITAFPREIEDCFLKYIENISKNKTCLIQRDKGKAKTKEPRAATATASTQGAAKRVQAKRAVEQQVEQQDRQLTLSQADDRFAPLTRRLSSMRYSHLDQSSDDLDTSTFC
jgi:hypothetical protein